MVPCRLNGFKMLNKSLLSCPILWTDFLHWDLAIFIIFCRSNNNLFFSTIIDYNTVYSSLSHHRSLEHYLSIFRRFIERRRWIGISTGHLSVLVLTSNGYRRLSMKNVSPFILSATILGLITAGCGQSSTTAPSSSTSTSPAPSTVVVALPVQTTPNWFFRFSPQQALLTLIVR